MAYDYARLRTSVVIPALSKFGTPATYKKYTSVFTVSTGANARTLASSTAVNAVISDFRADMIDGTMIRQGDKHILVAGIVTADIGDEIVIGTVTYHVIAIRAVAPAGDAVLYDLQARP